MKDVRQIPRAGLLPRLRLCRMRTHPGFLPEKLQPPLCENGRFLRDMILCERKTAAPWDK